MTPLGTREVEEYELPPWQFDKILYIEKTGLKTQLAPYRLGEKYDMAVSGQTDCEGGEAPDNQLLRQPPSPLFCRWRSLPKAVESLWCEPTAPASLLSPTVTDVLNRLLRGTERLPP